MPPKVPPPSQQGARPKEGHPRHGQGAGSQSQGNPGASRPSPQIGHLTVPRPSSEKPQGASGKSRGQPTRVSGGSQDLKSPRVSGGSQDLTRSPRVSSGPQDLAKSPRVSGGSQDLAKSPRVSSGPQDLAKSPRVSSGLQDLTKTPRVSGASKDLNKSFSAMSIAPKTNLRTQVQMARGQYQIPSFPHEERKKRFCGTEGRPLEVRANHFPIKISCAKVIHYDIEAWNPNWPKRREARRSDVPVLMRGFEMLKKKYPKVFPKPYAVAFDGLKNAFSVFSTHMLNFDGKDEWVGTVTGVPVLAGVKDEENQTVELHFKLKWAASVDVRGPIEEYCREGRTTTRPLDAIRVINIVFEHIAQERGLTRVGRNFFSMEGQAVQLADGMSLWTGTFASMRPGWKPFLNVDMASKPGYEKQPTLAFLCNVMRKKFPQDLNNLSDKRDYGKAARELKDLKIRFNRPDGAKRDYPVRGLVCNAHDPRAVKLENGKTICVAEYFDKTYGYRIRFPLLPCLHVGSVAGTIYVPMELTEIKAQTCPNSKKLSDVQTAAMIKGTAVAPKERQQRILEGLKKIANNNLISDPMAKEFGISVEYNMALIRARVLNTPDLEYPNAASVKAKDGKWSKPQGAHYIKAMELDYWGVLCLSDPTRFRRDEQEISLDQQEAFVNAIYYEGARSGLRVGFPLYSSAHVPSAEKAFRDLYDRIKREKNKEPQLIMVLLDDKNAFVRSLIKLIGDVDLRMPTQFVMKRNVLGKEGGGPDRTTVRNICLKLNSKLGGTNQVLHSSFRPPMFAKPMMVLGADVTHPSSEDYRTKPSIAAVVGSMDPRASIFHCEVRFQESKHGTMIVEEILKMEEMTKSLLIKFYQSTSKLKPEYLIYYRDGVSEGQFHYILNQELSAIRRACKSLEAGYEPKVLFVVAQKRHKTRLFPKNESDGVGRNKNVPPGTVVDTVITSPTEDHFFLVSHEGIQGTSRPTSYHKLWDDNNLSANDLQKLTFYLCHLYSRCERSVSYPAPTYYAHLAAFRAREHHNALLDKEKGSDKQELMKIEKMNIVNYFV